MEFYRGQNLANVGCGSATARPPVWNAAQP